MAAKEELRSTLRKNYDTKLFAVEVLSKVFGSLFEFYSSEQKVGEQPNKTESKVIESVGIYAKITLDDEVEVLCYEIDLKPHVRIDQSKVAIQHYVRKLLTSGQAALINFVSPTYKDMWRFTLVAKDSELTSQGIQEKATHPKRYTFLVEAGTDKQNKTLTERLEWLSIESDKNMEALIEAFSVEKMSKAFFDEYKEHYQNFVQYLTGKRMVRKGSKWEEQEVSEPSAFLKSVFNGNEKDARDFCKKLLGRIIFLYFVQKKKWLGASDTNYEDGSQNFIFELFEETGGDKHFFLHGLAKLFFNALNSERPDDDYTIQKGKKVKIPYLNGGLFTRDEVDELLHEKGDMMTFPSKLFSNPENEDTPIPKGASIVIRETPYRGFLDFLNAFNFTVYEDSQDDHTVAVDPEMLGHIFENLLEDNKNKGAYYTPKEVVGYMCQESLLEYLHTHLGERIGIDELGKLVREKETNGITETILLEVNQKLDEVKICDPAIGSGAFPMGLLQEIFSIKEIISYEADLEWNPAKTKEDIIQNSIYGVDIEKGAVDIARLRFWLSLVVDKDKPKALPNLDYKIVVGDSLLSKVILDGKQKVIDIDWSIDTTKDGIFGQQIAEERITLIKAISDKQKDFFDPKAKNKKELKKQIRNLKIFLLIKQLESMVQAKGIDKKPSVGNKKTKQLLERHLETLGWKKTIKSLKELKNQPNKPFNHFDWRLDFPEVLNPQFKDETELGFDIVIGNPPYISNWKLSEINREEVLVLDKAYNDYLTGHWDIFICFLPRAINILKSRGTCSYILPTSFYKEKHSSKMRNHLINESKILELLDFDEEVIFENVARQTGIIRIKNELSDNNIVKLKHSIESDPQEIDQNFFNNLKGTAFKLSVTEEDVVNYKKINEGSKLLGNYVCINTGVVAHSKAGSPIKFTKDDVITRTKKEGFKPYIVGSNLSPYHIKFEGHYMDYDSKRENFHRPKFPLLFDTEKIVVRRISGQNNRFIACYDDSKYYSNDNLMHMKLWSNDLFEYQSPEKKWNTELNPTLPIKYLLAILNSKLNTYYFKNFLSTDTLQGSYSAIYPEDIRQIPIKILKQKIQKRVEVIVDYIIYLKKSELDKIQEKLIPSYFEQIIDGIVYELYFPELLKKYDREIIKHLGELPAFTDGMSDQDKMNVCKSVFKRLDNKKHPVRNNIFYMDSIPEIAIIEGKNEDH